MRRRLTDPLILVLALGLLAAAAWGSLDLFYTFTDFVSGRDADQHVANFYNSVAGHGASVETLARVQHFSRPKWGVLLRFVTLPFWWIGGSTPMTFGAVNVVLFLLTCLVFARSFRCLGVPPAWTLPLGLVFLANPIGYRMVLQYNLDGVYLLTIALAFHLFLIAPIGRADRPAAGARRFLVLGSAVLLAVLGRLIAVIYLAVPIAAELGAWWKRRRSGAADGSRASAPAKSPAGSPIVTALIASAFAFLLIAALWFYLPKIGRLWTMMFTSTDFDVKQPERIATGVWTARNWLWFVTHAGRALAPAIWALVLPLAALAIARLPHGRRAAVALFCLAPYPVFSIIMGTRYIEYLAPSIAVLVFLAVVAVGSIRALAVRTALVAALLFFSAAQFWWIYQEPPLPQLLPEGRVNRLVKSAVTREISGLMPDFVQVGDTRLAHVLGRYLETTGSPPVVVLVYRKYGNANEDRGDILRPLFDRDGTRPEIRYRSQDHADPVEGAACLIVVGDAPDGPPADLAGRFRPVTRIRLGTGAHLNVYFPARGP